jgi:hypothetical protein
MMGRLDTCDLGHNFKNGRCEKCGTSADASDGCCHTPGGKGTDTKGCRRCHAEVYNCDRDGLMSDRHPKWQRVEPGTVIPAGQPYRVEQVTCNYEFPGKRSDMTVPFYRGSTYFVDSSWKPPLELPTEPTWGIALVIRPGGPPEWLVDEWRWAHGLFRAGDYIGLLGSEVRLFIPFTDEQVARIEAAR